MRKLLPLLLLLLTLAGCLTACQEGERRPPGYLRVGNAEQLAKPMTFIEDKRLLLRLDEKGFYVMSTECTHDLTALVPKKNEKGEMYLASQESTSTYDMNGKVLTGPATVNLPYYELIAASGVYGGPVDTIYARIGYEKPADWRLPVVRRKENASPAPVNR
jgi:Rieske Fe-S protein